MSTGRLILGIFLLVWGVSWLLGISLFRYILPLLVIWFGFKLVTGHSSDSASPSWEKSSESGSGFLKRVLIFSGINKDYTSKDFSGAEIVCIFGGGELDLSRCQAKSSSVVIDVVAIFGGLKLILPSTWSVNSEGIGILGGYDNKTQSSSSAKVKVALKGVAILGGVEIVSSR